MPSPCAKIRSKAKIAKIIGAFMAFVIILVVTIFLLKSSTPAAETNETTTEPLTIKRQETCRTRRCENFGNCLGVLFIEEHPNIKLSCQCKTGFSGIFCELTPCSDQPCKNGGDCILKYSFHYDHFGNREVNGSVFDCVCRFGFEGDTCEISKTDRITKK